LGFDGNAISTALSAFSGHGRVRLLLSLLYFNEFTAERLSASLDESISHPFN
jgi:hypothetical protein